MKDCNYLPITFTQTHHFHFFSIHNQSRQADAKMNIKLIVIL